VPILYWIGGNGLSVQTRPPLEVRGSVAYDHNPKIRAVGSGRSTERYAWWSRSDECISIALLRQQVVGSRSAVAATGIIWLTTLWFVSLLEPSAIT
jgi:hypothetical protein